MQVRSVVAASSLAEIAWVDADGLPRATGAICLVDDQTPVLALTADRAEEAHDLAAAGRARLVLRDPRATSGGWEPLTLACGVELVLDHDGLVFEERLLGQELRKYPPARRYADSPLLMREHWWYLPRLLVRLDPVAGSSALPEVRDHHDATLVTLAGNGGVRVDGVRLDALEELPGDLPTGPALLFGQGASVPDLEVWERWTWPGTVTDHGSGVVFETASERPSASLRSTPEALRLRERIRTHRAFAAACRRRLEAGLDA